MSRDTVQGSVKRQIRLERHTCIIYVITFSLLLTGCNKTEDASLSLSLGEVFPSDDSIANWQQGGEIELYNGQNLYNLVNGQADAFFAYGFEQVGVQRYENRSGSVLRVHIWRLMSPANAYGLFTSNIAGDPFDIGNGGDIEPGLRLAFWQNRYFVQIFGHQPLPEQDILDFAQAISSSLPAGGERPKIVSRLPREGLLERSELFFHEEISVMSDIWLVGENLLGLSQETDGVLARYEINGEFVQLMLLQYPTAQDASEGLKAFENGQIEDVVAVGAYDNLLGVVFGQTPSAAIRGLLNKALNGN